MEKPRNKIRRDISTFSGKEVQTINNNVLRRYTESTQ
jgi:hypothetical protein